MIKATKMFDRQFLPIVIAVLLLQSYVLISRAQNVTSLDTTVINQLLRKGNRLYKTNPDSAIYFYQSIYNDFTEREAGFPVINVQDIGKAYLKTVIRSVNRTGDIYYYNDEYKRSEMYYRISLELAKSAGLNDLLGRALLDIGYIRYVNNEYQAAIKLFKVSLREYSIMNNEHGMFNALNAYGLANKRMGIFHLADSCYFKALEIAERLEDSRRISDIKINRGILLCEQGELEEGTMLFGEALKYYEESGNIEAVSDALLNIGVVMKMVKEYDKALDYISRSTEIEEARQKKSQLVARYYHLADLYLEMKENEKAYAFCTKIKVVAEEIASKPFIADCNFLLGKYYFIENNNKKALEYYQTALIAAEENNNKPIIANICLWYSKAYLQAQNYTSTIKMAYKSYDYALEMNLIPVQKEISSILSEAYEKTGNIQEALNWQRTFHALSDSISYFEQQKEIKKIESRYNYEKKEKENELLRNRATLQNQKLKSRNFIATALVMGIFFSILIIVLLYKRNKDAKILYRQQQMLNLQKLEDTSNELESKKRELTSKMMFLNQKNELVNRIINQLQEIQDSTEVSSEQVNSIVSELRVDVPQSNWKEFETQFVQVHPDFYKQLYEKYPDLTSHEQRVCAFLRMNLNTKEIASITGRSMKSIEVTRSRIRKKLNLTRNDNLSSFLASF